MTALRLSLVAGLLVLGCLLVLVLVFVPRRPAPTGPQAVSNMEVVLRDLGGRSLPVTVWYPGGVREPAPVILYSPGWAGTRTQSSIQIENLASHGFVAVGCDDIASDPALDPDRGVSLDLGSDAALKATIERGGRHVAQAGQPADRYPARPRKRPGCQPRWPSRPRAHRRHGLLGGRRGGDPGGPDGPSHPRRPQHRRRPVGADLRPDRPAGLLPAVQPRGISRRSRVDLGRSGRAQLRAHQCGRHTAQQAPHGTAAQLLVHDRAGGPRRPRGWPVRAAAEHAVPDQFPALSHERRHRAAGGRLLPQHADGRRRAARLPGRQERSDRALVSPTGREPPLR